MLKVLDLFSGIGGFSLGLERAGMETVAFCEIDPFCRKVLRKHWPDVPIYEDVKELRGKDVGPIDVICGGYPCHPFSTASAGRRVAEDLWPHMLAVIERVRPQFIITENVAEVPQKRARNELQELGYSGFIKRISGNDIGADHGRVRWWGCSYADNQSELYSAINAKVAELSPLRSSVWGWENYARAIRISNGASNRMDRNKALGNAVIPQIPEIIGRAIMDANKC